MAESNQDKKLDEAVASQWRSNASQYRALIADQTSDSTYLRERGLVPNVIRLTGDCSKKVLLDAGTGSGWLFKQIRPMTALACDLVRPPNLPSWVTFNEEDVHEMTLESQSVDIVVASLVLCYTKDLERVAKEFRRIIRANGRVVIALVHPYFYRTGEADKNGDYVVNVDLSEPQDFTITIGGVVGPFKYYYRPTPTYLSSFLSAGWKLERISDWFFDADAFAKAGDPIPEGRIARSPKVPVFMFLRFVAQ